MWRNENEQIEQLQSINIVFNAIALWPVLRVPPASVAFMLWSLLTSLANNVCSAAQLATRR